MRKEKLIGKKVILKNVHCIEHINGLLTEEHKDVTGILEKIGVNSFFGWDICATVDGNSYKLITLSQIQPIYR
tara:strand:- start:283 stop:501 length:219 start_codon:yes stop_codon:yes gene_type:complete